MENVTFGIPADKKMGKTKKIMVFSGKGGVGKSTVSANLAYILSMDENVKVGLMDVDIHGPNIPKFFGVEDAKLFSKDQKIEPVKIKPNLLMVSMGLLLPDRDTAVIWRGPLKIKLIKQFIQDVNWQQPDYMVIDLPPGTGDEPLSIAQEFKNVDGAVIVTTPQDLALLDSRKAVDFARKLNIPVLGIIENMSGLICPYCGKRIDLFKTGGGKKAAEELKIPFLGAVPIDPKIVELTDEGIPYLEKFSDSEAGKAFKMIAENITKELEKSGAKK